MTNKKKALQAAAGAGGGLDLTKLYIRGGSDYNYGFNFDGPVNLVYGDNYIGYSNSKENSFETAFIPSTYNPSVLDITWNGSIYVLVGPPTTSTGAGEIFTSSDGITWTKRTTVNATLHSVAWSPSLGLFAAVGRNPANTAQIIVTSPDGITWTSRSSGSTATLNKVIWTGSNFLAVGNNQVVVSSTNGVTWSTIYTGTTNYHFRSVLWDGSKYVAAGSSGLNGIYTSSTGTAWTARTSPNSLYGVTWSGSLYVAVGFDGNATSTDGLSWTSYTAPFSSVWRSVTFDGTNFYAGLRGGNAKSSDGVNWSLLDELYIPGPIIRAFSSNDSRCFVTGTNTISYSDDGIVFTETSSATSTNRDVSASGSNVVVVADQGKVLYSTDNGLNFSFGTSGTTASFTSVHVDGSNAVAAVNDKSILYSTNSGATWSAASTSSAGYMFDVNKLGSTWIGVGNSSSIVSGSISSFTARTSPVSNSWYAIATSPSIAVIVGGLYIATSVDGITWTLQHTVSGTSLRDVVWTGDQFIALGVNSNTIYTSPDGINWTFELEIPFRDTTILSRQGSAVFDNKLYIPSGGSSPAISTL